jgi:hypothetical protein
LGVALALALALVTVEKIRLGVAVELLWICYPAAAVLCVGLLFDQKLIAAAGALFHLAVGLPYWIVGLIATGTTTVGSVAVHCVAPLGGLVYVRKNGMPPQAKWLAIPLYLSLWLICRLWTPPERNVNLVFGPYEDLHVAVPLWLSQLFNLSMGALLLYAGDQVLRRAWARSRMVA